MLGNSHNLNGIVAGLLNSWQDALFELLVGRNALLLGRHADMGFIYQQIVLVYHKFIIAPIEWLRDPKLRRVVLCRIILDKACSIGRNTVMPAILSVNVEFIQRSVRQAIGVHRIRQKDAPHSVCIFTQAKLSALPIIEIAKDIDIACRRQPLTEPPARHILVVLPTEVAIAICIIDNRAAALDLGKMDTIDIISLIHRLLNRLQPLILGNHCQMFSRII